MTTGIPEQGPVESGKDRMKRFENILYVAEFGVPLKAFHHAAGFAEGNNVRLTVVPVGCRLSESAGAPHATAGPDRGVKGDPGQA